MRLPKSVRENLVFLLAETSSQIKTLQVLLEARTGNLAQRILDRHGYAHNLKMRVLEDCLETLRKGKNGDVDIVSLRAGESIASDLERITDLCFDCIQLSYEQGSKTKVGRKASYRMLGDVYHSISLIEQAIEEEKTSAALKISKCEERLDRTYRQLFQKRLRLLKKKKKTEPVIASLFVIHRIKEMGRILSSISESIISAQLGQPMHSDRFHSLKEALKELDLKKKKTDVTPIAETKSGSAIAAITEKADKKNPVAIFKDGQKDKLKEERESVESWHEIYPGLAPQIISYKKRGRNAALLIEHLPGQTFEKILLSGDDALLKATLSKLCKTLRKVWDETKTKDKAPARHMVQLKKRLPSVVEIHPAFDRSRARICSYDARSLKDLIARLEKLENKLEPPFNVYIHGDFNLDNIIYDPQRNRIKFIDLHRSKFQDYVQDVSVFMVSNYRLQVLDAQTRLRISQIVCAFYGFAKDYADKNKDKTFEVRLALGLARSFITSTRFILDQELAQKMFLRGFYLLEKLDGMSKDEIKSFTLPIKDLFR